MKALGEILQSTLAQTRPEPTWLAEQRREAVALLNSKGLPGLRDEAWKYTSLKLLDALPFRLASSGDSKALTSAALAALNPASSSELRVVFVNGHLRADLSTLDKMPEGITLRGLATVLAAQPDILKNTFACGSDAAFTALNTATLADGVVLDIADNVIIDEALALVFVGSHDSPLLRTPRLVMRAGRHSKARIIEEYLSPEHDHGLTNVVTQIDLAEGAELHHHRLQSEGSNSAHIGRVMAAVGRNAHYCSDSIAFGGLLTRIDIEVALRDRGARCRLNGLFAGRNTQHIDHHTIIDHQVGDTHSEELYRGVLDDRSRGVFNGKVIVRKDAQKISARQASNNLLLSHQAEIDTKPELEIYADDVTCAHGATVGELDRAALFYLRSRGIAQADARALLIYAFAEAVIKAIPLNSLRDAIEQRFIGHRAMSELLAGTAV